MSNYRRVRLEGGCYFFTLVTYQRQPLFAEPANIARLREGLRRVMAKRPFEIDAAVVLPDHLHCLWRLPEGDADYSTRWRLVKHYFSQGVVRPVNHRGEKSIWQRRFWEHTIRNQEDWRRHVDYIHYNPVKHGHAKRPADWIAGSFQQALARGWYEDENWGMTAPSTVSEEDWE